MTVAGTACSVGAAAATGLEASAAKPPTPGRETVSAAKGPPRPPGGGRGALGKRGPQRYQEYAADGGAVSGSQPFHSRRAAGGERGGRRRGGVCPRTQAAVTAEVASGGAARTIRIACPYRQRKTPSSRSSSRRPAKVVAQSSHWALNVVSAAAITTTWLTTRQP